MNTRSCNLKQFEAVYCGERSEHLDETVRVIVRDKRFNWWRRQSVKQFEFYERIQEEKDGDRRARSSTDGNIRVSSGRSIRRLIYNGVRQTVEETRIYLRHTIHLINQTNRSQHTTRRKLSFHRDCKINSNILSGRDSKYSCFNVGGRLSSLKVAIAYWHK